MLPQVYYTTISHCRENMHRSQSLANVARLSKRQTLAHVMQQIHTYIHTVLHIKKFLIFSSSHSVTFTRYPS